MSDKNKELENGLNELLTRDIEQLLLSKKYDQAKGAMEYFVCPRKVINEMISYYK